MPGRILGWLLVCEPAHQSAEELMAALQVSRGSVSMAMRMPRTAGAVERHHIPGQRRVFYRIQPGFWLREAHDMYAFPEREYARIKDLWLHERESQP